MSGHTYAPQRSLKEDRGFIIKRGDTYIPLNLKAITGIATLLIVTNLLTFTVGRPSASLVGASTSSRSTHEELYLLEKAGVYVQDLFGFEEKVRSISRSLHIPPEWLMAVMYSESRFDAHAHNHRGSGAVGLIQWMPTTASELKTSTVRLARMSAVEQLDYVYDYLKTVRSRYGEFNSLTDLYLGILFPKALDGDYCYTLYAKPSRKYRQNSGLDENRDGRVTVSDIDKRMQRIFPTAYLAQLGAT